MGSGYKDFAPGDVLTAADVDGYLMRQTVMTFADASARDSALSGVLDEGMVAYLEDTDRTTYYTGSAWVDIARLGSGGATKQLGTYAAGDVLQAAELNAIGTTTAYTPTVTQGATTFGMTVSTSNYWEINKLVIYFARMSIASGTGVGGNALRVSIPVTAGTSQNPVVGSAIVFDSSLADPYSCGVWLSTTSQISFQPTSTANWSGIGSTPNIAFGTGDIISFTVAYVGA